MGFDISDLLRYRIARVNEEIRIHCTRFTLIIYNDIVSDTSSFEIQISFAKEHESLLKSKANYIENTFLSYVDSNEVAKGFRLRDEIQFGIYHCDNILFGLKFKESFNFSSLCFRTSSTLAAILEISDKLIRDIERIEDGCCLEKEK